MIRTTLLFLMASCASAVDLSRMPSALGDARFGGWDNADIHTNLNVFTVQLPHDCAEFTFISWMRINVDWMTWPDTSMTAGANYCPENIQVFNPDLLQGRGGYPTNTTVSGSITLASFPWHPYTDAISSNQWPRGVYTIAGWSSNIVTVTLGGQDVALGPGEFNRNVIPGPSDSCVISGSGLISIGISRTPDSQWFQNIHGSVLFDSLAGSIITNELALCVWRLHLDSSIHVCESSVYQFGGAFSSRTQTNSMPRSARIFFRNGIYKFGLMGANPRDTNLEWFDPRVFTYWLSNAEILRIRENGLEEIQRRGIPRWK